MHLTLEAESAIARYYSDGGDLAADNREIIAKLEDALKVRQREETADCLERAGYKDWADRRRDCGAPRTFYCKAAGHKRKGVFRCELPICPACAPLACAKQQEEWRKIKKRVPEIDGYGWKLLTLTIAPTLEPAGGLRNDYTHLRASWRKMRARLQRENPGCGGFSSIEVGDGRNVHLHTLCYLPYVPRVCSECGAEQSSETPSWCSRCCGAVLHCGLSPMWQECSGSPVCDLRAVYGRNDDEAFREVCKYITKIRSARPAELVEIWKALRGATTRRSWGVCYKQARYQKCARCDHTRGGHSRKKRSCKAERTDGTFSEKNCKCWAFVDRLIPCMHRESKSGRECGCTDWHTDDSLNWLGQQAHGPPN